MAALRELQESFRAAILAGADDALLPLVRADGLSAPQRLQVYRNNVLASLADALEANFPVVVRLVGDAFFRGAAHAFIRAHPPRRPSLAEYGDDFAEFLAGFPPARVLPYLPDVARLEWLAGECRRSERTPVLDSRSLADLAQEAASALQLTLQPCCRLFQSPFPVDRIWLANQPGGDSDQTIDLDAGGCRLLVSATESGATLFPLDDAALAFLACIGKGSTLGAAYDAAAGKHGRFDLAALLAGLFQIGAFAAHQGA
jgi:hypothetical protein